MDLPYFRVFPAETISDERYAGWTPEERGVWFHLLQHAWVNGSVPADEASLARLNGMKPAAFRKVWQAISDRFILHPDQPGRLTSRRLELEREEALAKSKAGKKGARSRWDKAKAPAPEPQCEPDATALPSHGPPIATPDATAMPVSQRTVPDHNAPQRAGASRTAMLGVGSPAFGVVTHWRERVWPTLSSADCPDVLTSQVQSLTGLVAKHGEAEVIAALDRAAADPFWKPRLELDAFVAKFPRFLPRTAESATSPQFGRAPPRPPEAFQAGEVDLHAV